MNLAYKKILGKFTKVLGFGKTPPHVEKNSQIISFFFMRAYLTDGNILQITWLDADKMPISSGIQVKYVKYIQVKKYEIYPGENI